MPIQKTSQLCSHCFSHYNSYNEALACEKLGIPENPHPEGSIIVYENEMPRPGKSHSHSVQEGTVIFAFLERVFENKKAKHQWVYVIDHDYFEIVVKEVDGFIGKKLFSSVDWKHHKGYAEMIRKIRTHSPIAGA